jgi:phosphoribosyl 1,2-cyclic phosphate phosphodiesterase
MAAGEDFRLGDTIVHPVRLAEDYVDAFLLRQGERRALIAGRAERLVATEDVQGVDVAVLPMGIAEFHPLTGDRLIHEDHRLLQLEATFDDTLEVVKRPDAGRVYLTHVEEMDQLGHDELGEVGDRLRRAGLPVEFAYDTLVVEV